MRVLLAEPRGFCAGVDRAIEVVERTLEIYGAPVYVRHEIVHNRYVVESLKARGAIFVDDVTDAPAGSLIIFSAHGVSQEVRRLARARGMRMIDATCPLVTKVHLELLRCYQKGCQVILIGHAGHPEVEGTMGQVPAGAVLLISSPEDVSGLKVRDPDMLAYLTQTTLSVDDTAEVVAALKSRFPNIHHPKKEDICYATSNRQQAVKQLAKQCSVVLVVGSRNSSNSNRLREVAIRQGADAYLIDSANDIQQDWLNGVDCVGLTAGASAPEILVLQVVKRLKEFGAADPELLRVMQENVTFNLPKELRIREA